MIVYMIIHGLVINLAILFMNGRHWKLMLVITMQCTLFLLISELILIMLLFLENPILLTEREFMKILLVCFLL